jgi:hypothetical protein
VFWALSLDLGHGASFMLLFRGIAAHFLAGSAATALVVFAVVALQGIVVATVGPRIFEHWSALFQVALVVGFCLAVAVVPAGSSGIVAALQHPDAPGSAAILAMPASWLLGLYEVILGHLTTPYQSGDLLRSLALRALLALAGTGALAVVADVFASRRVLRASLAGSSRFGWNLGPIRALVVRACAWTPDARAVASFTLTSLARVERQRLALGVGIGLGCATGMMAAPFWHTWMLAPAPARNLLTLPMTLMMLWLAALRVAFSLPADLKAAWIFDVRRPGPAAIRAVVERLMLLLGVVPFAIGAGALVSHWDFATAATHALITAALGWLVTEILMGPAGTIPGSQPWRPERAKLRARWPLYLIGFIWVDQGFPLPSAVHNRAFYPEQAMLHSPTATVIVLAAIGVVTWILRRWGLARAAQTPIEEETESMLVTVRLT